MTKCWKYYIAISWQIGWFLWNVLRLCNTFVLKYSKALILKSVLYFFLKQLLVDSLFEQVITIITNSTYCSFSEKCFWEPSLSQYNLNRFQNNLQWIWIISFPSAANWWEMRLIVYEEFFQFWSLVSVLKYLNNSVWHYTAPTV